MTLFTDNFFLTDDPDGFRVCRETRTSNTATMSVIYCEAGYLDVYFHGKMLRINAGEMFVRVPDFNFKLGPYELSPDLKFKQVTISTSVFETIMHDHMRVEPHWWAKLEYLKKNPIFAINAISVDFLNTYFHLLQLQLQDNQTSYRKQILMLIARGAAMEMLNYLDKLAVIEDNDDYRNSVNQSDYTFREFTKLLQQYPHKREVQWYAQQLGITPKYLSEICKERSGKAAGEWIADVTVSEIKHYLHNTTKPIHEIARVMEFPNASFFCQYTKKHTGLTPNHFRKQKSE